MSLLRNIGVGRTKLINEWMSQNVKIVGKYHVNEDLTIDVDGDVIIVGIFQEFPEYIRFETVSGYFYMLHVSTITSLHGCPRHVGGYFDISYNNKLISLEGGPDIVDGNFNCRGCHHLDSLVGCPRVVGYNFFAENCGSKFSIEEIKAVCNVRGEIFN